MQCKLRAPTVKATAPSNRASLSHPRQKFAAQVTQSKRPQVNFSTPTFRRLYSSSIYSPQSTKYKISNYPLYETAATAPIGPTFSTGTPSFNGQVNTAPPVAPRPAPAPAAAPVEPPKDNYFATAFDGTDADVDLLLQPKITVFGVGGGGSNTVNTMIERKLQGVEFVVGNTDAQALKRSRAPHRVQLGKGVTKGLGAGASPELGRKAAEESKKQILEVIDDSQMVFLTAGMGGGTGTGAAPVIAGMCKELGILTVAIVTTPFSFEGNRRLELADSGIQSLQKLVDTIVVVPNQQLLSLRAGDNKHLSFNDAFSMVDSILYEGVQGVTDLIVRPGIINLDFADVRTVMRDSGRAIIGTGEAEGEHRATKASEKALFHPLLDETDIAGAKKILINITGGPDLTLFDVSSISQTVSAKADPDANIIFGTTLSDDMTGRVRVSVFITDLATRDALHRAPSRRQQHKTQHHHVRLPLFYGQCEAYLWSQQQPKVTEKATATQPPQEEETKPKGGLRAWFSDYL